MNRRTALAGAAATGVVAIVAGCETYGDLEQPAAGATLAQLGDVPVGGGIVLAEEGVVLTPTNGPATAPLPPVAVTMDGTAIRLA